jgi:hypothetical protein
MQFRLYVSSVYRHVGGSIVSRKYSYFKKHTLSAVLLHNFSFLIYWLERFCVFRAKYISVLSLHECLSLSRGPFLQRHKMCSVHAADSYLRLCSVALIYVAESHTTAVRVLVSQRPHDQLRHVARGHYGGDRAGPQDAKPTDHPRRTRHGLRQLHVQRLQHGASLYLRLRLRR